MDSAESSERTCSIDVAIHWETSSWNDELLNLDVASIWLSQFIHSDLLVLSKVLVFFIICLLMSSFWLLLVICVRIFVNASVILADGAYDILFMKGVCMVVLVLG